MILRYNPNLAQLLDAASKLQPLLDEIVFVGGCATGLLITDPASAPVRATLDVDAIVEAASYEDFAVPRTTPAEPRLSSTSNEGLSDLPLDSTRLDSRSNANEFRDPRLQQSLVWPRVAEFAEDAPRRSRNPAHHSSLFSRDKTGSLSWAMCGRRQSPTHYSVSTTRTKI